MQAPTICLEIPLGRSIKYERFIIIQQDNMIREKNGMGNVISAFFNLVHIFLVVSSAKIDMHPIGYVGQ